MKSIKVTRTICFMDEGQDFLEWDLDSNGKISDSRPLEADAWCGAVVINCKSLRPGGKVVVSGIRLFGDDRPQTMRYPIKSIRVTKEVAP